MGVYLAKLLCHLEISANSLWCLLEDELQTCHIRMMNECFQCFKPRHCNILYCNFMFDLRTYSDIAF